MTGLVLLVTVSLATIVFGFRLHRRPSGAPRRVLATALSAGFIALCAALVMVLLEAPALAAEGAAASSGLGFIGASLATGMACLGAGIAVAMVGAAALGAVAEKPELLGTTLIYLGLAEGIAIYGVIVSLLILGRL
ncbi:MAG: ATPase [Synergistaceae bacterium]|jgi:V/A-type H+-transporting ATPase subunit K|nr:ATPase [Synergistaceae bacterium]